MELTKESIRLLTEIQNKREHYRRIGIRDRILDDEHVIEAALKVYLDNTGSWD
jgi:hypothetical protein